MTPSQALKSLVESHEKLVAVLVEPSDYSSNDAKAVIAYFASLERSISSTCLAIEKVCDLSSAAPHSTAESPEGLDSVSEAAEFPETARHAEPSGGFLQESPPPATHDDTTNPETVGEEEGGGETDAFSLVGPGGGGAANATEMRPTDPGRPASITSSFSSLEGAEPGWAGHYAAKRERGE